MGPYLIQTDRLALRPFTLQDASGFYHLNLDPEVIRYTGDVPFASVKEAKEFINAYNHYKQYGYGRWALCLKPELSFIGFCGLKYHPQEQITEVGFRLFKEYWNKGLATEAALACIDFGFKMHKLPEIFAHAQIENTASIRVIEKCGMRFVREGVHDGHRINIYSILNPEK